MTKVGVTHILGVTLVYLRFVLCCLLSLAEILIYPAGSDKCNCPSYSEMKTHTHIISILVI